MIKAGYGIIDTKGKSNMMKIKLAGLLLSITAMAGLPVAADACECPKEKISLEAEIEQSDIVFTGKVVAINYGANLDTVKVEGDLGWKGVNKGPILLQTNFDAWSCDVEFTEGESYIIFGKYPDASETAGSESRLDRFGRPTSRKKAEPIARASICGHTGTLEESKAVIDKLGRGFVVQNERSEESLEQERRSRQGTRTRGGYNQNQNDGSAASKGYINPRQGRSGGMGF